MAYMDTHYGHHSDILGVDSYSKDRVISCGLDRQVIFWKINEDSELIYQNPIHTVDSINLLTSKFFITGSSDNAIDLWDRLYPDFPNDYLLIKIKPRYVEALIPSYRGDPDTWAPIRVDLVDP